MDNRVALSPNKFRKVVEAYHGPMTKAVIARRCAVSESTVSRTWAEEKAAGRLPAERPHFARKPVEAVEASDVVDVSGETPIGEPNPTYVGECDALLAALRKHHANDPGAHDYRTYLDRVVPA